ncbi:MAG: hypothetical protein EB015_14620 [Methylocystaceae bacterium]|nr:hypothetical protein [Methylocystaceae bacterium]
MTRILVIAIKQLCPLSAHSAKKNQRNKIPWGGRFGSDPKGGLGGAPEWREAFFRFGVLMDGDGLLDQTPSLPITTIDGKEAMR